MPFSAMILPLLLAAAPVTADTVRALCPSPAAAPEKATFKRLGELPPAEAFLAVYRSTGCPAPVILARDKLSPVPRPRR